MNVLLFVVTCFTVATMHIPVTQVDTLVKDPSLLFAGVPFAATLMSILLAHEMGHYLTARRHGVKQTLPFFIPAPTRLAHSAPYSSCAPSHQTAGCCSTSPSWAPTPA